MENSIVFIGENNKTVTNSVLVAQKFDKNHRDVLRAIQNLTAQNCAVLEMFVESSYLNAQNKE